MCSLVDTKGVTVVKPRQKSPYKHPQTCVAALEDGTVPSPSDPLSLLQVQPIKLSLLVTNVSKFILHFTITGMEQWRKLLQHHMVILLFTRFHTVGTEILEHTLPARFWQCTSCCLSAVHFSPVCRVYQIQLTTIWVKLYADIVQLNSDICGYTSNIYFSQRHYPNVSISGRRQKQTGPSSHSIQPQYNAPSTVHFSQAVPALYKWTHTHFFFLNDNMPVCLNCFCLFVFSTVPKTYWTITPKPRCIPNREFCVP